MEIGIEYSINKKKENKNEEKGKKERKKIKAANTNVICLELGGLGNAAEIATGDANYCQSCKSMLNSNSILTKFDDNIAKIWKCEFCNHQNQIDLEDEEIPKVDTLDFLLESASINENKEDCNTILFLIDISGSMW